MELQASRKRSVIVRSRRTSISLEDSFWEGLKAIVQVESVSIGDFIEKVKSQRKTKNLSSSLRVAVLEYYRSLAPRRDLPPGDVDMGGQSRNGCGSDSQEHLTHR
jgi:predicted DNA-binding ribbon-helix-helix protein